jgi:hypothetical protein
MVADRPEQLAQLHATRVLFLNTSVPVVQRTEQGFPKGKTALLHKSADVVSCLQIAVIEPVELLLRSSRALTNLHIFICPGDTKGDTNFSTVFICLAARRQSHSVGADENHGKPFFNAEVSLR